MFPGFPGIAESIYGWSIAESKPMIDFLFNQSLDHSAIYRHRWLPGDMVFWANRSVMHLAAGCPADQRRRLYRTTIEGDTPT